MIRSVKMFYILTLVLNSYIIENHLENGENGMYKKMYFRLFNAITDVLEALEQGNIWDAKRLLKEAQCATEEMYISAENDEEIGQIVEIFRETAEGQ